MGFSSNNTFTVLKWKFCEPLVFDNSHKHIPEDSPILSDNDSDSNCECEHHHHHLPRQYHIEVISTKAYKQNKFVTLLFDFIVSSITENTDVVKLKMPVCTSGYYQNALITKEYSSRSDAMNCHNGAIIMGTVSTSHNMIVFDSYQFDNSNSYYRITGQLTYEAGK